MNKCNELIKRLNEHFEQTISFVDENIIRIEGEKLKSENALAYLDGVKTEAVRCKDLIDFFCKLHVIKIQEPTQ